MEKLNEPTPKYRKDSIRYGSNEGGRSLEEYARSFHLELNELNGKTVLDLGSGLGNRFNEELVKQGSSAEVISLSPDYSDPNIASIVRSASPEGKLVAGLGQELPFGDETFDRVFALHLFEHLHDKDLFHKVLKEIGRVLKSGGIAKIGPVYDWNEEPFSELKNDPEITKFFASKRIEITREDTGNNPVSFKIGGGREMLQGYNVVFARTDTRDAR